MSILIYDNVKIILTRSYIHFLRHSSHTIKDFNEQNPDTHTSTYKINLFRFIALFI